MWAGWWVWTTSEECVLYLKGCPLSGLVPAGRHRRPPVPLYRLLDAAFCASDSPLPPSIPQVLGLCWLWHERQVSSRQVSVGWHHLVVWEWPASSHTHPARGIQSDHARVNDHLGQEGSVKRDPSDAQTDLKCGSLPRRDSSAPGMGEAIRPACQKRLWGSCLEPAAVDRIRSLGLSGIRR